MFFGVSKKKRSHVCASISGFGGSIGHRRSRLRLLFRIVCLFLFLRRSLKKRRLREPGLPASRFRKRKVYNGFSSYQILYSVSFRGSFIRNELVLIRVRVSAGELVRPRVRFPEEILSLACFSDMFTC